MPVLRSFCVYCSIGIFFLFLMQSTLFPACLTLNQRRVEANRDGLVPCIVHEKKTPDGCGDREFVAMFFKKFFAPVILSKPGKIIVILLTVTMAAVMGYGVSQLQKGFEFEKSLPEDSYVRHFLEAQRIYFASEGPGIQVYCTPMDYQKNINVLDEMAKTYQNSSVVMYGLVANWIPMYKLYAGLFGSALNVSINEDGVPSDPDDFHNLLRDFFKTPLGLPFSKYVEMTDTSPPEILWTYFPMQQIVSQDVWENEYIMEEVRRIADTTTAEKLHGGRCFVYSVFHIFTEVIRYIDSEIMRNFILAGIAIFIVTLLLIVDFVTSFFVLVCVGLTLLDIMGSLQYWGFYMDVNAVVLLIISIGLAVDFSAHVGYTFMTVTGTKNERTTKTLCQIGPAILHGAVTTYLVFFVLVFGKSLSLFFGVFILVVKFGLFHGLCFLPVVLSIIGPSPYYNAGPEGTDTVGSGNQDMEMGHDNPMGMTQAIVGSNATPDGVTNRSDTYSPDSSTQYTNDNSGQTFDNDNSGHQCTSDSSEQQTTDKSEELTTDKSEQNTTDSSGQTLAVDPPKYEDVLDLYDTADSCQISRDTCDKNQDTLKGALAPGEKGFVHTKL